MIQSGTGVLIDLGVNGAIGHTGRTESFFADDFSVTLVLKETMFVLIIHFH